MEPAELGSLLARISLGNRPAFSRLYDATAAKLFGVCLRILKDRQEAEDAVQDVYVKVWQNAKQFQPSGASPMAWLVAIARNQAIDRLRARRAPAKPIDEALELADAAPGPESMAAAADDKARIDLCLDQLPQDRAAAVRAAYVEGYSYLELAQRFGQPLNTMRTWLRRSLLSLRECLEQ